MMANFNGLKMVGDFLGSETIMETGWPQHAGLRGIG